MEEPKYYEKNNGFKRPLSAPHKNIPQVVKCNNCEKWQSTAKELAEALQEARSFTLWCEQIIETEDEQLINDYNKGEISFLTNSYKALDNFKKLNDGK